MVITQLTVHAGLTQNSERQDWSNSSQEAEQPKGVASWVDRLMIESLRSRSGNIDRASTGTLARRAVSRQEP